MMKWRLIIFVLSFLFSLNLGAQRRHIVQRGETFATVAKRYNLTESELTAANPTNKECYAGLNLVIPEKKVETKRLVTHGTNSATGNQTAHCDGSGVKATRQVKGNGSDGHEYVDLGLPSGTLWATCNIGASSPEDYGDYFAWGETTTKSTYNWSTYKYCNGSNTTMTKYCTNSSCGTVDNKTELDLSDDAAYVNWGSQWRMPSKAQFTELINSSYTTTTWTTQNGKYGRKITSKSNGNSMFLPAAGCRYDASRVLAGSYGHYWSRSLTTSYSHYGRGLDFYSSDISTGGNYRYGGWPVRPVHLSN